MDDWYPQPKQEQFLRLPWYEALFGGTKGPGKTDALLAESTRQLSTPGYQAIIFRRTLPKLAEIIERSHKWFSQSGAVWNGEKHRWTWPNRNFIAFGYCKDEKDKYNYQGHEYGFMGFDQVEEFTLTQYLFLLAQNRTSAPGIKCYTRSTSNPGNVGHAWVKDRFIDRLPKDGTPRYFKRVNDEDIQTIADDPQALSRAFVFAQVEDNKALLQVDPDYIKRLDMLPETDRKALRFGDWDIFAGQFFREFSKAYHVISAGVIERLAEARHTRFISFDYGYAQPASVGWYMLFAKCPVCDGDHQLLLRHRELYSEGYTYEGLAEKIIEMTPIGQKISYAVADPAIWGDVQHHLAKAFKPKADEKKGESGGEMMTRLLKPLTTLYRADNSRIIGWGKVREILKLIPTQSGGVCSKFMVTDNCRHFIRTIPGLIHDTERVEDVDTTGEDHAADELRYAVMSRPPAPKMPEPPKTPAQSFWDRVKKDGQRHDEACRNGGETRQIDTNMAVSAEETA